MGVAIITRITRPIILAAIAGSLVVGTIVSGVGSASATAVAASSPSGSSGNTPWG